MRPLNWARIRQEIPARLRTQPFSVLVPIVAAQWLLVLLRARSMEHNGWYFFQNGGETRLYSTAWSLAHAHIPATPNGYGWSLLTAPIAAVAGANFLDALPALVLVQTLVLLPVALLAVYGIASRVGGRLLGYFTAACWVVVPYAAGKLFQVQYAQQYRHELLPQALGLTGLGSFPSMVCVLVAAYFALSSIEDDDAARAVLAGLFAGFAIAIDASNALFLAAPAVGYAAARRPRAAAAFGAALLPALLTLTVWRLRALGHVPHVHIPLDLHHLESVRLDFRTAFYSDRLVELPFIAGALAIARQSWTYGAFVAAWFSSFVLVQGSAAGTNVGDGSWFGVLMPAFPAFVIACACIPLLVPRLVPRLGHRLAAARLPQYRRGRRFVAVCGALLAALPLLVVVALPVQEQPQLVMYAAEGVLVPVDAGFPAQATAATANVSLSWPAVAPRGANVFYKVFAGPRENSGGIGCDRGDGATRCALRLQLVGTTNDPAYADRLRGGATYRVGIAPRWSSNDAADVMVLSPPVSVNGS
jgi:hypothetical protein